MTKTGRNVAIIAALAAIVAFLPGGGSGANTVVAAIKIAFYASGAWFAAVLYRQHRLSLYSLGDRWRAILYVAVGVIVLTLTGTSRMWASSPGELAWLVLMAGAIYAVFLVARAARRY